MNSTGSRTSPRAIAIAVSAATLACVAGASAVAEDTGRWEALMSSESGFRSVAPLGRAMAPSFRVVLPRSERLAPPKPRVLDVPVAAEAKPAVPPDPSKRENPLSAVLSDSTLRFGDIVVFPDGPRVFKGHPGSRHSVRDFASVAASKDMPKQSRKKLLAMAVGENDAWSSDLTGRTNKLAGRVADVETTGSLGKTVTVRTGRGDVRVIRVPD